MKKNEAGGEPEACGINQYLGHPTWVVSPSVCDPCGNSLRMRTVAVHLPNCWCHLADARQNSICLPSGVGHAFGNPKLTLELVKGVIDFVAGSKSDIRVPPRADSGL
ncbi:MAG: hypothetical protein R3C56_39560 [Pirellulaceae bacterium]